MSNHSKKLVIIAGPTAIGKSDLAIKLAQHFKTEIFSADSRQIYKEMTIGTAKPSAHELKLIKHHMIDVVSIHDEWDVFKYEQAVINQLTAHYKTNDTAILVGGTGLYIKAVTRGLNYFPDVDPEVLKSLELAYETDGLEALANDLKTSDPEYYDQSDIHNPRRVIRALSVIKSSGNKFSFYLNQEKPTRSFDTIDIKLTTDRSILYERINQRVDKMMELGLLDEVKSLYPYKHLKSLQTIGYKELFDHLDRKISLEFAIDKIKQHSRNYAKRQTTWFSNNYEGVAFETGQHEAIIKLIQKQ